MSQKLKRDNEQLLEALHKEQDKSYKLLRDLHQTMQESKGCKGQLDDTRLELDKLRAEKHRMQEVAEDNERMRVEIQRMQQYISDQESGIEQHRHRIRDTEKTVGLQLEQTRLLEAHVERARSESTDLRRVMQAQAERAQMAEQQLQGALREGEELKHSNQLLF